MLESVTRCIYRLSEMNVGHLREAPNALGVSRVARPRRFNALAAMLAGDIERQSAAAGLSLKTSEVLSRRHAVWLALGQLGLC